MVARILTALLVIGLPMLIEYYIGATATGDNKTEYAIIAVAFAAFMTAWCVLATGETSAGDAQAGE